ncbi:MAG: Flp pilus assembly protein CpaB [Planctomycetota bacterium]
MKRSKAIIPLVLGLVIGVVALKLGIDTVRRAQGSHAVTPNLNVVVATVDIAPTVQITPEMVVVKRTPQTPLLPSEAFTKIEEVVKRVTNKTIPAGTPISPAVLAPEGTVPGLQVRIEEGYRAVSVKIDEVTGVAYQLLPGNYVDVLVVMDVNRGRQKETISRVILQHVQVAAVGQLLGDPGEEGTSHQSKAAKSATLLVPAEDVPKLHLAQIKGKITLALRGGEDESIAVASNARESELTGETEEKQPEPETAAAVPTLPSALASTLMAGAPPARQPFTTTVINGPLGADASGQVLRVTYKDVDSMEVIEVSKGRTAGDTNSLRFGSGEPQVEQPSRSPFGDRDRTLRRKGARNDATDGNDQDDPQKETEP